MLPRNIFKKHTHIGLDLDETLASTFSPWLDFVHTQGHLLACRTINDIRSHDLFSDPCYNISKEQTVELWHQYWLTIDAPTDTPYIDGAIEGVEKLVHLGKDISIITARNGNDPLKKQKTKEWVHHFFPNLNQSAIHFVNHYSDQHLPKSEVCKNIGVTLVIDDHIDNAKDLTSAGISMILLEKPWNRAIDFDHPLLYRAKDWQEIIDTINE